MPHSPPRRSFGLEVNTSIPSQGGFEGSDCAFTIPMSNDMEIWRVMRFSSSAAMKAALMLHTICPRATKRFEFSTEIARGLMKARTPASLSQLSPLNECGMRNSKKTLNCSLKLQSCRLPSMVPSMNLQLRMAKFSSPKPSLF